MQVRFLADDPRHKARPMLDGVLNFGSDQLAIACAFCTDAGIELLMRHTDRLRKTGSFVVVSVAPPTDYPALTKLYRKIPENLYVHWGAKSPEEKKVKGAALMHSKVFYARSGNRCCLWTGSHNLTGNATQGGNCEAAIMLDGTVDEEPFVHAMQHLLACRNEATLYDPTTPPIIATAPVNILAIHAEADGVPSNPLPWYVQLALDSAEFDDLLNLSAQARLFLYPKGALSRGWQSVSPIAGYSGSLTGQNRTATNPSNPGAGTAALWTAATFGIAVPGRGVPVLSAAGLPGPAVATQALLHLNSKADLSEDLFSDKPKFETRHIEGETRYSAVDDDMRRFFKNDSIRGESLVHVPYTGKRDVLLLPADGSHDKAVAKIRSLFPEEYNAPVEYLLPDERRSEKRHPFIVRVRSKLREE